MNLSFNQVIALIAAIAAVGLALAGVADGNWLSLFCGVVCALFSAWYLVRDSKAKAGAK